LAGLDRGQRHALVQAVKAAALQASIFAWVARIFLAALTIYFFVMTIVFSFLIVDFFIAPVLPKELKLFNDKIKTREPLKYLATFQRNNPCRTDIQRFIVYKDKLPEMGALEEHGEGSLVQGPHGTEFIGYRDSLIGIITQGDSDVIQTVSVMDHPALPLGRYVLRVYAISTCNLITRMDAYPEVPFEVVE
jgi:hypothetical protein